MTEAERYLDGLRRGDAEAVERLVGEFEGPLFRYFLARHGDDQLAGEQSTDCFVALVRALPRMRGGPESLRGFVYAVARNVERRRWRRRDAADSINDHLEVSSEAPGPERQAEGREGLQRALAAINRLDAVTRDVFLLRFVEQLPLQEIALALDEPLGTIKSRLHRGRKQLQALLTSEARNR